MYGSFIAGPISHNIQHDPVAAVHLKCQCRSVGNHRGSSQDRIRRINILPKISDMQHAGTSFGLTAVLGKEHTDEIHRRQPFHKQRSRIPVGRREDVIRPEQRRQPHRSRLLTHTAMNAS